MLGRNGVLRRGETPCITPDKKHLHPEMKNRCSARRYPLRSSEGEGPHIDRTNKLHRGWLDRSFVGKFRNSDPPLYHRAEEYLNEGRVGVQLAERSLHLGHLLRQCGDNSGRGKPLARSSTFGASPKRNMEKCESNELFLVEDAPSRTSARVLPQVAQRIGCMAEQLLRQGKIRSSSIANSTSIQERPRCNCWRRYNNMFHRQVTPLERSARQGRTSALSSWIC